ncbi:MAG: hypothetical protein ING25_10870 [Burkholderiales bacterium]|nr:hypothetical protein [Burkholderiales bacterium]
MSFKKGDRVVVTSWRGDKCYRQGWVGTVTELCTYVRVLFDKDVSKGYLVYKDELSMYVEPKAAAIAGGLQPHSVGDLYPLAVVTYANGDGTAIFVENLQEGTVATKVKDSSYPYEFDSHDQALAAIENGKVVFSKGRPHYIATASIWVLYNETNPVRVVRLHNMLHRNEA